MNRLAILIVACMLFLTLQVSAQGVVPKPPKERDRVEQLPGNAEKGEVATHPKVALSTFLDDSFVSDSRKDYEIKGDVQWTPGKLALPPKASISRSLRCGPRVRALLRFNPPAGLLAEEPRELKVVITPASVASIGWDNIAAGVPASVIICQRRLENKQFELSVTAEAELPLVINPSPWTKLAKLSRKFVVERPTHVSELEIEYRFGVISVLLDGKPILYGQTANAAASPKLITVEQSLGLLELNRFRVSVSTEPKLPSVAQRFLLLEASAAEFGGVNQTKAGQLAQGEKLLRKSHDLYKQVLGDHEYTQDALRGLASNLLHQGKYAEAHPLLINLLDQRLQLLGEMNDQTLSTYNSLALSLNGQGKNAEAQPLLEKTLRLNRELLGDRHQSVAQGYNNLALNLSDQGKYAEAQPLFQRALDLRHDLFGEQHPDTAQSYSSVAIVLRAQRKYAEAVLLNQKALDIISELQGEEHPSTENAYINLAFDLKSQGKYVQAQALYQKSLDLSRKLYGEKSIFTAGSYNNLAHNLESQGMYDEALRLHQKVLELRRDLLGEQHPDTANSYCSVALGLIRKGKSEEAQVTLEKAIHSFEARRLARASGLQRAVLPEMNPYLLLAMLQLRRDPEAAWSAMEMTLARGLFDQQADDKASLLTQEEQLEKSQQQAVLDGLQSDILVLSLKSQRTEAETKRLDECIARRRQAEERLATLAIRESQREIAQPAAIRAALADDAALICWGDYGSYLQEHWGCVVRKSGESKWERLPGTGLENKWTEADSDLPSRLREALAENSAASEIAALTKQLHAQRLAPLAKHLGGVKKLYVVPVSTMVGIPVDALTTDYTISYLPSGTFLARLRDRAKPSGSAILAVADPIFAAKGEKPKEPESLPPHGLLITFVVPGGAADNAGLRADDAILRYGVTEVGDFDQLKEAIALNNAAKAVPVAIWREDSHLPLVRNVAPGMLGTVLAPDPAPLAIVNRRKAEVSLLALRGGDWDDIPGTRVEANQILKLFGPNATLLTDESASEQKLDAIRQAGGLTKYRYLHFATHGEGNNAKAFESALILSQDTLPKDVLPRAGEPLINGQLSASEVLEFWKLDAELVTLSACETAVGSQGGGDGPLGFAQAFLTAGARSVCLSLWKVDDAATTLLMDRFYQNLLGKRPDLDKPMGKAAALAEAKNWLRNLTSEEALKLTADMTKGVARGKGQKALPVIAIPEAENPAVVKNFKPFEHPKYWAAFILIGDPD